MEFNKDYNIAARFCDKNATCPYTLNVINCTETEVQATTGMIAIRIETEVPANKKNKSFHWQRGYEVKGRFPNLEEIFITPGVHRVHIAGVTPETFWDAVHCDLEQDTNWGKYITFDISTCKMNFDMELIELALSAFEGEQFNIHVENAEKPLLMENDRKAVIVMPVRVRV